MVRRVARRPSGRSLFIEVQKGALGDGTRFLGSFEGWNDVPMAVSSRPSLRVLRNDTHSVGRVARRTRGIR